MDSMSKMPFFSDRGRQRGVTLIELLVGVAIGLIVAAALLGLYANASLNGYNLQRTSVQIENARYAGELLREDLELAGFFGEVSVDGACWSPSGSPNGAACPSFPNPEPEPDPCATVPTGFNVMPLRLPTPVRGYGAGEVLGCLGNRRAGTDAIAVRRLEVFPTPVASLGGGNAQYYVQHSFCEGDPPAAKMVFGKDAAQFTLRNRACTAINQVRAYISRIYFVADCNRCGVDTIPTLKRLDLVGNQLVETPLVEGIETLRFEYGLDTEAAPARLDGIANEYRTDTAPVGEASRWSNVVSLKVHYIVRSIDAARGETVTTPQTFDFGGAGTVATAADGFQRRAYSTTVRLVNPAGARELQ
jgi:type IV pilus assembly protein PilW